MVDNWERRVEESKHALLSSFKEACMGIKGKITEEDVKTVCCLSDVKIEYNKEQGNIYVKKPSMEIKFGTGFGEERIGIRISKTSENTMHFDLDGGSVDIDEAGGIKVYIVDEIS